MTRPPFCVDVSAVVTIQSDTIAAMLEIIHNVLAWLWYPTIINVGRRAHIAH